MCIEYGMKWNVQVQERTQFFSVGEFRRREEKEAITGWKDIGFA